MKDNLIPEKYISLGKNSWMRVTAGGRAVVLGTSGKLGMELGDIIDGGVGGVVNPEFENTCGEYDIPRLGDATIDVSVWRTGEAMTVRLDELVTLTDVGRWTCRELPPTKEDPRWHEPVERHVYQHVEMVGQGTVKQHSDGVLLRHWLLQEHGCWRVLLVFEAIGLTSKLSQWVVDHLDRKNKLKVRGWTVVPHPLLGKDFGWLQEKWRGKFTNHNCLNPVSCGEWANDPDNGELIAKGGRYRDYITCVTVWRQQTVCTNWDNVVHETTYGEHWCGVGVENSVWFMEDSELGRARVDKWVLDSVSRHDREFAARWGDSWGTAKGGSTKERASKMLEWCNKRSRAEGMI